MEEAPRPIAVFDVCDTLFSVNTTLGFLSFYARRTNDPLIWAVLERWTSRSSPSFYLGALTYRLARWDLARTRLIATLRGHSRSELNAAADEYVTGELSRRVVEPVHARLLEHRQRGDRVILASSSLDIVISAIALDLGVEWVASTLGFSHGKCTGLLVNDLTGRKPAAISALAPSRASLHVYTDNRSDKALLRMADRCTIILPAGSSGRQWAGEDCDYLAL
jgi:phosphoserine phosphatase